MNYNFQNYSQTKPTTENWYVWRLNSRIFPDIKITFTSKYRKRGAGFESVMSPDFDHWDGWRVNLPPGLIEWCEFTEEHKNNKSKVLKINDLELKACPFCKNIPKIEYSGLWICSTPIDSEYFYLSCCAWIGTNRFSNPVEMIDKWNKSLT